MLLAKIALALCIVLVQLGTAWSSLSQNSPAVYLTYLALALLAYGLETDGANMGFLFLLIALPKIHWIDALLMANLSIILHIFRKRERPSPFVILRTLASTSIAAMAAQAAYHAPFLQSLQEPIRLMIAAGFCFLGQHCLDWKKENLWSFPYYTVAASITGLVPTPWLLAPLCYLTWRSCRIYEHRLAQQREQSRAASELHLRTMEALAFAIEARDQPFTPYSRRVQIYAVEMAKEMGLDPMHVEALRVASLLYDVGELAVPENIIHKPGPLTPEEYEKVKIHPSVAAALLEQVNFPYDVASIVRGHHERWDGQGYPNNLKGDQIPVGARILAVADALDSLASRRHHRDELTLPEALKRVCAQSGQAYDPRIVSLLRRNYKRWERMASRKPEGPGLNSIFAAKREAQALFEVTEKLAMTLELSETFEVLKSALQSLIEFEMMAVYVEREGALQAEFAASNKLTLPHSLTAPIGGGVSGAVAASGQPVLNGDASLDFAHLGPHSRPAVKMAVSTPLNSGEMRGALTLYRIGKRAFSNDDARVIAALAPPLSLALANGLRFKHARGAAASDPLTGLGNAKALFEKLRDQGGSCAVVVCDLDGFKNVNDRFGHLKGNEILQEVAEGFRRSCRERDFVARLGGDEFVLVLAGITPAEIGPRLTQFRDVAIEAGRRVCGESVLDASFGSAFFPADGKTPEELLACADRAMYRRKAEHRSGVTRFERRAGA